MSIYNLQTLSTKDLKKLASEYISLDDVYDECEDCGGPVLFHQEEECTRDVDKGLKVIAKNWRDLKRRLKPVLKEIKTEREKEQNVYLDGIERIVNTIQMQISTTNPEVKKDENTSQTTQHTSTVNKPRLLTKPAKVPTWTRDLTF